MLVRLPLEIYFYITSNLIRILLLLAIYFVVGALAAACQSTGAQASQCKQNMCEMVGTVEVCTECNTAGQVPINGTCTLHSDSKVVNAGCKKTDGNTNVGDTDKTCSKCDAATYFLYKGGCYSKDAAPGNTMCTAVSPNGVCSQAAEGYFVPPGADATHDSVVSCGDSVTGVTLTGDKQYKGVANCEKCNASKLSDSAGGNAECTKCVENKYLTTAGACGEGCTEGTQFSTETAENGKKCFDCRDATNGVDGCEKCTAPGEPTNKPTCTKCSTKYLKTVDGATTCVAKGDCKDDFFPVDDSTNGHRCVSCGDETGVTDASNKKWNCVANCAKCTQPSAAGTAKCEECNSGYTLDSQANTCTSSSANKSALSTGAIAGISVAAVVVVGGLVGFLCWWFVYHSKKKYVPA
ncbi:Variant-specific surface protein [Giardia duodenalis assemblage B]|uniref:Variant-specific surface protein n=1 Tax=Giardia duodenalis assemblage B TaxID=1394984 RepID=A0A132NRC8_GIAIN|nr:Variant-specific surface protein [Giardia intestinalis assemblage B]